MKRRTLIAGAGLGATLLAVAKRPTLIAGQHDAYFESLSQLLRVSGIDAPALVIDLDRLDRNIDRVKASVGGARRFRVAVKSVPSVGLVDYIIRRSGQDAGMVFSRAFVQAMAKARPRSDLLLGKPMPVAALAAFYDRHSGPFDPQTQLQWLVDSPQRLAQYLQFAQARSLRLRVNIEIDVGLHRGGVADLQTLAQLLATVSSHPQHLVLSGLMGYDGHLKALPGLLAAHEAHAVKQRYAAFLDVLRQRLKPEQLAAFTLNGAGSPSFRWHESDSPINDVAIGSALLKPSDFDLPTLTEFEPAAFIATPVLKRGASMGVPTLEWLQTPLGLWDRNRHDTVFIHGGKWMAEPVSPAGLSRSDLYTSSNQEAYYASADTRLGVDDHLFLRPRQSEAVLLEFGDLVGVRNGQVEHRWPVVQMGA